ncbi:hypothetical protein, partial [Pseudomonas syringae group genomosp. 7]|uniref:hypothetical protein n=1 Tax=Pseudomonas syringae group genomosp. 7 TaxID=251699 RepID=UPI00376FCAF7
MLRYVEVPRHFNGRRRLGVVRILANFWGGVLLLQRYCAEIRYCLYLLWVVLLSPIAMYSRV